jgi:hypothetical protein
VKFTVQNKSHNKQGDVSKVNVQFAGESGSITLIVPQADDAKLIIGTVYELTLTPVPQA